MIELVSPMAKGKIIRRKFTMKIEDAMSESLPSLMNFLLKSKFTYSADIKIEIKAETNAIATENSNPRVPIREKGVSIRDIKIIKANGIRTFFEKNIFVNITRFNLQGFWF
jgi:hypothetical protein